jgi:hypothetical protein
MGFDDRVPARNMLGRRHFTRNLLPKVQGAALIQHQQRGKEEGKQRQVHDIEELKCKI